MSFAINFLELFVASVLLILVNKKSEELIPADSGPVDSFLPAVVLSLFFLALPPIMKLHAQIEVYATR